MPRDIDGVRVPSTEFAKSVGKYMDEAGRGPVIITRHQRDERVIIDVAEYERLKRRDTRKAIHVSELTDEEWNAINEAEYEGPVDPALEALMD